MGKIKTRVLLFEDEKDVREVVLEILNSSGYEATSLDENSNIIPSVIKLKPDLIISDIMMPGKTGFDIFNEIKNKEEIRDIPFIFLTAKSDYMDIRFGMNLGADDYILKPFKAKDLLRSVELRLEKSRRVKERLNNFSSSIALHIPHEMRTPLIALLGYSEMIIEDYDNISDNDIKEYAKNIKRSSQRLHKTIEKFILFSEILSTETMGLSLERFFSKEPSDISEMIMIHSMSTAALFNRQKDLKIELEPFNSTVAEESISIIISQLLENAFKFSEPDDIVEVVGRKVDLQYNVSISDNGIGMTNNEIENISPLQQFNKNYYTQGNGLGLAIVEKMLKFINSKLIISSRPGEGTKTSFLIT